MVNINLKITIKNVNDWLPKTELTWKKWSLLRNNPITK